MLHVSREWSVEVLLWQKYYGVIWEGSTGVCKKKAGCGIFFPFLCNLKHWSLPATSVLCHFRKTEVMLFLTVLCLMVDSYNCVVSPVCNFDFKTTFVLTAYFCLGQCCKFCAMKGGTLTGGLAVFPCYVYKTVSCKDFGAFVGSAVCRFVSYFKITFEINISSTGLAWVCGWKGKFCGDLVQFACSIDLICSGVYWGFSRLSACLDGTRIIVLWCQQGAQMQKLLPCLALFILEAKLLDLLTFLKCLWQHESRRLPFVHIHAPHQEGNSAVI